MTDYLCISEKPTAAKRLAAALDEDGKPRKLPNPRNLARVPVWECKRNGDRIVVIPALGHLYSTVEDSSRGWHYPAFSYKWVPSYIANKKNKSSKPFIAAFKKYGAEISNVIVATDYDLEGEVIGASIAQFACGRSLENVTRMKFSTLTKQDILDSFENQSSTVDINLANAGFTRHEIDWLFGINLTRALTLAIKHSTGRYKLVTTGRVQGPTLRFVAEKERKVQTFVPVPRWSIDAAIELEGELIPVEFQKRFVPSIMEAEKIVQETAGRKGIVSKLTERVITQKPPLPFNLSSLQSEAYRHFGYSPSRTLKIAETLYLKALISYPRTSSQRFAKSINHKKIMRSLTRNNSFRHRANSLLQKGTLKPTFGKKKDPAHPPIHPTGKLTTRLRRQENNLYSLIVCRYLAIFGEPAKKKSLRLDIDVNSYIFYLRGMKVLERGWLELYKPYGNLDETELPDLSKGDIVQLASIDHKQSFTQPPSRYNPNSLLKKMEEEELGTKATRANIIDILYSRGFIEDESINTTDLGFAVIDTLEKNSPDIISTNLTRKLERSMERIQAGELTREEVLLESIRDLKTILEKFHKREKVIGVMLEEQVQNLKQRQRILGQCPVCRQGELIITRSTRTKKRFVGCTGYYKKICDWSAPIPQKGYANPAKRKCKHCGFPMVSIRRRGKKAFRICPNWLQCPGTPEQVLENYRNNRLNAVETMGDEEEYD